MREYVFNLLIGLMFLSSCTLAEIQTGNTEQEPVTETVPVRFTARETDRTRSSIDPDEHQVRDMTVYAFHDGMLADEAYVTGKDEAVLELSSGMSYNIYAVANMGYIKADADEADFLSSLSYSIAGLSDLSEDLPMACFYGELQVGTRRQTVGLDLERLVAKISLSVDRNALMEGLQVKSARLCQSSSVVRPFKWHGKGGSRAEMESEVIDGDFATVSDLIALNDGGEIVFYALENCQGILLPENDDPFCKTPDMLGDKKDLCTYLEVSCVFGSEGLLDGWVDYRIYIGLDEVTSFDVPGNACIDVSLHLTDNGLKNVSWKVDADITVRDGYVTGVVSEGMHGMSDLYVGERILYEVNFADELLEYLGGDVSGCTLALLEKGVESDDVLFENLEYDGNMLTAEVSCRMPVEGDIYVYAPDGECLGLMEDGVTVRVPHMLFSEYPQWTEDEPVESLTYLPECEINGDQAIFYLYLVDRDGYNLNGARSYGFDKTLFSFKDDGAMDGVVPVSSIRTYFGPVSQTASCSAVSAVSVICRNSGTDHAVNLLLADIYNSRKSLTICASESYTGISGRAGIGLGIKPIGLTLVDNGWAGYHQCQLSMIVDNPSNLPLEASIWELVATDKKYGAVDEAYVESNLDLDHIEYMTGTFYNESPPFYGSSSAFVSERNDNGDQALVRQALLIYPLEGISTDDIACAVNYDKRGPDQMIHMLDVTICGCGILAGDLTFQDKVSDGSSSYNYIYYSEESRNYKGTVVTSGGDFITSSGKWVYDYPNLSAPGLDRMYERFSSSQPVHISMIYAPDYGRVSTMTYVGNGAQYGLTLSFLYSGVVNGYVKTYPKGTWYAAQNNYCEVDFSHSFSGVPLRPEADFTWADAGELKNAMDQVYAHSYKDSPRPLGADSYMHRAHPTDVELDVSVLVEGDKGEELYPFYVDWDSDYLEYWHEQDAKDYKAVLNSDYKGFEVVVVTHK